MASYVPPVDGSDGYVASRWASERTLETAAAELSVPVSIHRFTPATKRAQPTEEVKTVLDDFVHFADELRIMPELDGWSGKFDMLPAAGTASIIHEAISRHMRGDCSGVSFSHHGCNISMEVSEMRDHMEDKVSSEGYERMPGLKWVGRNKQIGFAYSLPRRM